MASAKRQAFASMGYLYASTERTRYGGERAALIEYGRMIGKRHRRTSVAPARSRKHRRGAKSGSGGRGGRR